MTPTTQEKSTQVRTKAVRPEKVEAVNEIKAMFEKARIAIFTEYQSGEEGLAVKEVQMLRRKLRQSKGEFKVVKNTLARKALESLKIESLSEHLTRASALAFGYDDPSTAAKAVFDFAKEQKKGKAGTGLPLIKGAWLDKVIISADQVRFLATLPPKPVLLSLLLGTMKAPISGMVNVLSGTLRSFVIALDAVRKQKEAALPKPAEQASEPAEKAPEPEAAKVPEAQASAAPAPTPETQAAPAQKAEAPAAAPPETKAEAPAAPEASAEPKPE